MPEQWWQIYMQAETKTFSALLLDIEAKCFMLSNTIHPSKCIIILADLI
jgi:hypothetical protein